MLEVRGLSVSYGPLQALFGVDLTVGDGEVVALIGPNGAGKTTTLNALAGLLPWQGAVTFEGVPLPTQAEDVVRRGVSLVPQGRGVFPSMSVEENLLLGAYSRGATWKGADARFARVFETFPVLSDRRKQAAGKLSGGEQQMLVIGRALVSEPRLVMIDELSLGLAPKAIQTLFGIIKRVNHERGTSFLLVEQAATAALALASSALLLQKGQVIYSGDAVRLRGDVEAVRDAYLGVKTNERRRRPDRNTVGAPRRARTTGRKVTK